MIQLFWYRRDLRIADHAPLVRAARRGPVLPLFVAEPDLARRPDFGARHWTFARDSLRELRAALAARPRFAVALRPVLRPVLLDFFVIAMRNPPVSPTQMLL